MTELNETSSRDAELLKPTQARQKVQTRGITDMSQDQVQKLVHELQTKQFELEMENEELRQGQCAVAVERERHSGL